MSAADRREELEAKIWRETKGLTREQIAEFMALADAYASAVLADALDNRARASRLTAAEASAAEHLEQLEAATGRTP